MANHRLPDTIQQEGPARVMRLLPRTPVSPEDAWVRIGRRAIYTIIAGTALFFCL